MNRSILRRTIRKFGFDLVPHHEAWYHSLFTLRKEFSPIRFAGAAIQVLLDEHHFDSVLDVGAGQGDHTRMFVKHEYNISVIVVKKQITLPPLAFDVGDINRLKEFFPPGFDEGINGDIEWL